MTILITGGTGKTGRELAKHLRTANISILLASRSGGTASTVEPFKSVAFDWLDPTTFQKPFDADSNIGRVYLVVPEVKSQVVHVGPFIDPARSKGVKRFALLSACQVEPGQQSNSMGQVHLYLIDIGVDYAVLRPSWFHQIFSSTRQNNIRDYDQTFSAIGSGRITFVSTGDVAQAAYDALTAKESLNKDILVFGPQLYTYEEVANLFSKILGREITHQKYTAEELKNLYISFGIHEELASVLSVMEDNVSIGVEEALFVAKSDDRTFIGKHTLKEYVLSNRQLWVKE